MSAQFKHIMNQFWRIYRQINFQMTLKAQIVVWMLFSCILVCNWSICPATSASNEITSEQFTLWTKMELIKLWYCSFTGYTFSSTEGAEYGPISKSLYYLNWILTIILIKKN